MQYITKSLLHVTVHRSLSFLHCQWDLIRVFFDEVDTPLITKIPLKFFFQTFSVNVDRLENISICRHSVNFLCYESLESFRFVFIEWDQFRQSISFFFQFFDSFTWWSLKAETVFVLGMKIINKQNKITSQVYFTKFWLEVQNQ